MLNEDSRTVEAKQEIIDSLLQELPSDSAIEVELPSECRIYTLPDPGAPITVRPMTFEDEKNIVSAKKGADPINTILSRCVTNVNIADLLSIDKLYLIMKLREVSYGDDYNTLLICRDCNAENPTTVKLSELNVLPVPDDFEDPVTVHLPTIKKDAKITLPRVRDEGLLADTGKIFSDLWRFVVDIDGHKDKSIIAAVLQKLPVKDTRIILNAMKTQFGIETKVKFQCKECGGASVVELPIDANFFDVS